MRPSVFITIIVLFFAQILHAQNSSVISVTGSQYVRIPNGTAPIDGRSTFTIEFWMKTSSYDRDIFGTDGTGAQANPTAFLYLNLSRTLSFRWGSQGGTQQIYTTTVYPNDGAWHHVAIVVTSGSSNDYIFIDGVQATMGSNDFSTAASLGLSLDIGHSNFAFFNGSIDEVRFWSTARTLAQIQNNMNTTLSGNESGLIGYWRFDETPLSSQTILDSQTNTTVHNGTLGATSSTEATDPSRGVDASLPLPVELVSFSGSTNNNNVILYWQTSTEINNYGFEIERSSGNSFYESNPEWEKLGFVSGSGTSNSLKHYSFTDTDVNTGIYKYRLKQIDNDGQYEYSKEIELNVGIFHSKNTLQQNYPNPFNPSTIINYTIEDDGIVTLKLYDILGNEISTLINSQQSAGRHSYRLSAENLNLSAGVYIYKLQSGVFTDIRKMLFLK